MVFNTGFHYTWHDHVHIDPEITESKSVRVALQDTVANDGIRKGISTRTKSTQLRDSTNSKQIIRTVKEGK